MKLVTILSAMLLFTSGLLITELCAMNIGNIGIGLTRCPGCGQNVNSAHRCVAVCVQCHGVVTKHPAIYNFYTGLCMSCTQRNAQQK